jgi:2-oxoglutarate ferredoxin oxidoreductase subunit alpha
MTDGEVGHMREEAVMPDFADLELVERPAPAAAPSEYVPFRGGSGGVPDMANFGTGYHTYVTGLTHKESGLPATDDADVHTDLVSRLNSKITDAAPDIIEVEATWLDDADIAVVSYGVVSRSAAYAVRLARDRGLKVGSLRLITLWPFPDAQVLEVASNVKGIIVPEMNLGQLVHPVREATSGQCEVRILPRVGGVLHAPDEILAAIEAFS